MINLTVLAGKLDKLGILSKDFMSMSRDEIVSLCEAVMSSPSDDVPADGWKTPFLDGKDLIIPFDAHPEHFWWRKGGKSVLGILAEIGAPEDVRLAYTDKNKGMRI